VDQSVGDKDYSFTKFQDIHLTLGSDYKVYSNGELSGKWTPVYDEGFILEYGQGQFTAFMKYYKNPQTRAFESNCDKTMIGWYIPNKMLLLDNWSCFFWL